MEVRLLTSPEELRLYEEWIATHAHGSLWQSLGWKRYQEALGREVRIYGVTSFTNDRDGVTSVETDRDGALIQGQISASALVVIDRTAFGLSTWEIARGPLMRMENGELKIENFIEKIIADTKVDNCLSLYISPSQSFSILNSQFSISNRFVIPQATRMIDLTLPEDALLAQMKPKGRYSIGLAQRHGVRVEISADVDAFYELVKETAARDGFRSPSATYYLRFLETIPGSFLLLAYKRAPNTIQSSSVPSESSVSSVPSDRPIAGLLGVIWGTQGIYYYGASSNAHRELMAPYLLQWEAMRHCKSKGCSTYDLFGIAPKSVADHPWAGVSEFKAKFGGHVVMYPPEKEIVLRPVVKKLLELKRRIAG